MVAGEKENRVKILKQFMLLVLLSALTACASLVVGGGGNRKQSSVTKQDAALTNAVVSAFIHDAGVPAFDIQVQSHHGVVTLTGYVANASIRQRAVRVAESVTGVQQVRNYLKVR